MSSPARLSETARVGGAGLLALVATYGIGRQAYGLFVPTFREEFGLSLEVLGFYASAAQGGYLVTTVATGVLTARYGPRLPVVAGCVLLAAGAAATASAAGAVLLAVGVVAAGTSAGGAWGPFSDAVARQVPPAGTRRALALVNAGSPVGLVLASALVLAADGRWRAVWWAFAGVGSAAVFGVGFTTGFALVAMWSQQVFPDRPTTGFTLVIVFVAAGFVVGPGIFGVLATRVDRSVALLAAAIPALLAALVSPSTEVPGCVTRRCPVPGERGWSRGAGATPGHR